MGNASKERPFFDLPPVYFISAILLMMALHRWLPIVDLIDPPVSSVGYLLIVGGIGLAVWGRQRFAKAGTNVVPFSPSTALVTDGPFQFTRNPMYVGMMLVLMGCFFLTGSLSGLLVIPLFFWWIRFRFVLPEEDHMVDHFGDDYLAYKQSVRRWI
jgi:protein-S-isoprenylcysteine O-methyltransferase Ste14